MAVCATRLEETDGRWTGRIVGIDVRGAKGRAVRHLAKKRDLSWRGAMRTGIAPVTGNA